MGFSLRVFGFGLTMLGDDGHLAIAYHFGDVTFSFVFCVHY